MNIYIMTDLEGVSGINSWDQCYPPNRDDPAYRQALRHLTEEVNAAVAGAFDGGAKQVFVVDGHGVNQNDGFVKDLLDPRARKAYIASRNPLRFEALDESISAVAMIGQHAMAGTINGFLDHTQNPKTICRFIINGQEHGELSQLAMYAGALNIPMVYASGDEALCVEARRIIPGIATTPTKRGTGWATCELYDPAEVRQNIRRDFANILRDKKSWPAPLRTTLPIEKTIEWAWSEFADTICRIPNVQRPHARSTRWWIDNPLDMFDYPNENWHPIPPPARP
ncbi:MAG: M55 family metallopeptidase [Phycisphaerales bacterium]|jgi:D-amino peptidase|nr:M55 family metallopeptidase [Phycisphaerales bacterium]